MNSRKVKPCVVKSGSVWAKKTSDNNRRYVRKVVFQNDEWWVEYHSNLGFTHSCTAVALRNKFKLVKQAEAIVKNLSIKELSDLADEADSKAYHDLCDEELSDDEWREQLIKIIRGE